MRSAMHHSQTEAAQPQSMVVSIKSVSLEQDPRITTVQRGSDTQRTPPCREPWDKGEASDEASARIGISCRVSCSVTPETGQ